MPKLEKLETILAFHYIKNTQEKYKVNETEIFGSYVRHEQKKRSDVDV